jgi:DNA-binding transcriptional MerR regulator
VAERAKPSRPRRRRTSPNPPGDAGERPLKIGEAARLLGVEPYVLRFWETQFPFLRPRHASSSHRIYQPKDLELLKLIKRLLHGEGYTIAGAKRHIKEAGLERLRSQFAGGPSGNNARPEAPVRGASEPRPAEVRRTLEQIRTELESLHKMLVG